MRATEGLQSWQREFSRFLSYAFRSAVLTLMYGACISMSAIAKIRHIIKANIHQSIRSSLLFSLSRSSSI